MEAGWLDGVLEEKYTVIGTLRQSERGLLRVLEHRALGKKLVQRVYAGESRAYEILRGIEHPNVLQVYDVVRRGDRVTVFEEYVAGRTLADRLERGGYLEEEILPVMGPLCDGLYAVHQRGVIHRDIKPENIMLTDGGGVKLIDFDASRVYRPEAGRDTEVIGTVGYAAPEQFGITQTDWRTDIYALGILLNVMLTGGHPLSRPHQGRLKKVIERCVQLDPDRRYPDVAELRRDLVRRAPGKGK